MPNVSDIHTDIHTALQAKAAVARSGKALRCLALPAHLAADVEAAIIEAQAQADPPTPSGLRLAQALGALALPDHLAADVEAAIIEAQAAVEAAIG